MTDLAGGYGALDLLCGETDADAFVHVADRGDPTQLFLTRFHGPDRPYAFVYELDGGPTDDREGTATLCAPALFDEQAAREFAGDRVLALGPDSARTPEGRAAALLDDGARVAVLDTAGARTLARLEDGGVEPITVDPAPVERARRRKTAGEVDRLRAVQRATRAGMRRAEAVLAASAADGDTLRYEGAPLTTERLRREVNATLAREGVSDAGNTVIGAGPTCADLHFVGEDTVRPGETVLLDISPRGPDGYYGDFTRTFVPGGAAGWERDVYDAVADALEAALGVLDRGAGVEGAAVSAAVEEALAAGGFGDAAAPRMTHGPGHGVGLALHEAPGYGGTLRAGDVVTIEPGLYDPARGGVRLEDLVLVTEEGIERFGAYRLDPKPRA
ncbi:M24 family metallopeptidase [Halosegnis marinus]|uniref:M24 family metallopeptidase n=1 Tax=Halosegnis marinus TaxID=3034023 RepID=A0ABD5ZM55_9EURY|nr:M24 family metallopeptidase [Halosegnis sp. DT85]